jgi:ubiquinone/menaquinone biosynthesis C-methylase UbiE
LIPIEGRILDISSIGSFRSQINIASDHITIAQHPEVDVQRLPYESESFDVVISDQVIEHVQNPWNGVQKSYRVLKKGGIAIHTTSFVNFIHPYPSDFWRFSPDAIRYLSTNFADVLLLFRVLDPYLQA